MKGKKITKRNEEKKDIVDKKLLKGNGKQKKDDFVITFWEAFLIEHKGDWDASVADFRLGTGLATQNCYKNPCLVPPLVEEGSKNL